MRTKLFLIYTVVLQSFLVNAQTNTADSLALIDLYNSTNGINWKNKTNWLSGPVSSWFGVRVTGTRVTQLSLINNHLEGTLPSSIGDFTSIKGIYLSNNKIHGSIPASLCNLTSLEVLHLSNNLIEGGIPENIGNITSLQELRLENNKITGVIPISIKQIRGLLKLILANNKLSGNIPEDPGGKQILQLELNNNELTGSIPATLQNIHNLRVVKLNNNQLTGTIPLGLIPRVCHLLDLSSNQLTGTLPTDFADNSTIAHINFSNNKLTGQIPNLTGMLALQTLRLDSNMISGSIPSSIKDNKRLVELNLSNNQLSGKIPGGICNLPDLQFLEIDNNLFTFDGMECIGRKDNTSILASYQYRYQKTLVINKANSTISLNAGGNLTNNTYYLFKDSVLAETQKGDSSFTVLEDGKYWIEVTNDQATKLTLYSSPVQMRVDIILPLQWLSFTAEDCSGNICLQWQTENEQNTSHFEIERSISENVFDKIGIQYSNNNQGKHTYKYTDFTPANGLNYYRIKQVDTDGKYTYSNTISIRTNTNNILTITPNPANNFIILNGISNAKSVSIYNMEGKLMSHWNHINGQRQLNISNLRQGIYIIKVFWNNNEDLYKLIKQ